MFSLRPSKYGKGRILQDARMACLMIRKILLLNFTTLGENVKQRYKAKLCQGIISVRQFFLDSAKERKIVDFFNDPTDQILYSLHMVYYANKFSIGNCLEYPHVGLFYFLKRLYSNHIDYNVEICEIDGGDHVVLLLNRYGEPNKSLANMIVCDPIFNEVFLGDKITTRLKDYKATPIQKGRFFQNNIKKFDPTTQKLKLTEFNLGLFLPYLKKLRALKFKGEIFNGIHLLKMKENIEQYIENDKLFYEQQRPTYKILASLCNKIDSVLQSSKYISCYSLLQQQYFYLLREKNNAQNIPQKAHKFINKLKKKYPKYLYWRPMPQKPLCNLL